VGIASTLLDSQSRTFRPLDGGLFTEHTFSLYEYRILDARTSYSVSTTVLPYKQPGTWITNPNIIQVYALPFTVAISYVVLVLQRDSMFMISCAYVSYPSMCPRDSPRTYRLSGMPVVGWTVISNPRSQVTVVATYHQEISSVCLVIYVSSVDEKHETMTNNDEGVVRISAAFLRWDHKGPLIWYKDQPGFTVYFVTRILGFTSKRGYSRLSIQETSTWSGLLRYCLHLFGF
jgi:hypothetical protein